ncbi:hypothetical protein TNCV_2202291 [Trichonephila clavipes]|uniref:Uncharacterized protein n=1 Tax=Trichonephila clavipes TaxID=2585209 RepID=A0A8X6UZ60_TRICX|nr:hypothetical protein TNCV_2202291 [Trichonephila clavipes]
MPGTSVSRSAYGEETRCPTFCSHSASGGVLRWLTFGTFVPKALRPYHIGMSRKTRVFFEQNFQENCLSSCEGEGLP